MTPSMALPLPALADEDDETLQRLLGSASKHRQQGGTGGWAAGASGGAGRTHTHAGGAHRSSRSPYPYPYSATGELVRSACLSLVPGDEESEDSSDSELDQLLMTKYGILS